MLNPRGHWKGSQGRDDGLYYVPLGRERLVWIPLVDGELPSNPKDQGEVVGIQCRAARWCVAEKKDVEDEAEDGEHTIAFSSVRTREHSLSGTHAGRKPNAGASAQAPTICTMVCDNGSVADT